MQLSAPALVRPRCYDPDTGDVVLLKDEIWDFLRTHERGTIEILGDQGAGKSTALEYLATLRLPSGVRLLEDRSARDIALNGDYEEQFFKRPEEIRKANLCGADLRGARIKDVDF